MVTKITRARGESIRKCLYPAHASLAMVDSSGSNILYYPLAPFDSGLKNLAASCEESSTVRNSG